LTAEMKSKVWANSGHCCWYCGKKMNFELVGKREASIDHVLPVAKGGTDDIENLVLACPPCNNRKHLCDPERFRRLVPEHVRFRLNYAYEYMRMINRWMECERSQEFLYMIDLLKRHLETVRPDFYGEHLEERWSHYTI